MDTLFMAQTTPDQILFRDFLDLFSRSSRSFLEVIVHSYIEFFSQQLSNSSVELKWLQNESDAEY